MCFVGILFVLGQLPVALESLTFIFSGAPRFLFIALFSAASFSCQDRACSPVPAAYSGYDPAHSHSAVDSAIMESNWITIWRGYLPLLTVLLFMMLAEQLRGLLEPV